MKHFPACPCRHTSQSPTVSATSEVVQQLQQDLSKKNMFFSKDFITLYKVIGQGKNILSVVFAVWLLLYPASVVASYPVLRPNA